VQAPRGVLELRRSTDERHGGAAEERALAPLRMRSHGLVAEVDGFNLHAGVSVAGDDRAALERLCRYMARPAVASALAELSQRVGATSRARRWDGSTRSFNTSPRSSAPMWARITALPAMASPRIRAAVPKSLVFPMRSSPTANSYATDGLWWSLTSAPRWRWLSPGISFVMSHTFFATRPDGVTPATATRSALSAWLEFIPTPSVSVQLAYTASHFLEGNGGHTLGVALALRLDELVAAARGEPAGPGGIVRW